ncbi:EAL domain-containing protein [Pseudomonas sp. R2.Fl]|nr:EAL domain-containing protein [Pseudomonas sp. R2.Fl]
MDYVLKIGQNRFVPAIREAQTRVLVANQHSTIAFNAGIAVSVAFLTATGHGRSLAIIGWLAAVLLTLLLRILLLNRLQRRRMIGSEPERSLKLIGFGALTSGFAWATLPFIVSDFNGNGPDAYVYLIMMGISAGAVIRGIGCAYPSLAFAVPPLLSIMVSLAWGGGTVDFVLATNVAAFILILVRSSIAAERVFVSNELGKLEATSLAGSLSRANQDIQHSHNQLEVVATRDPLTGLANRGRFAELLAQSVATATTENRAAALLLLDVDRFKTINDTLGHGAGDVVLKEVSSRLNAIVGTDATLARLGGDEFAILVDGANACAVARRIADSILERGRQPIVVAGTALSVSLSIGLASYPEHATTAEDLLACADMALYAAKERGRRRVQEFDPTMKSLADRQRMIEQDLERAIAESELEVWFQPQIRLDTGEIAGFEALLRWFHPELGAVSPPEVVQAAQAMHIAERLTEYVADGACRMLSRLPELGLPSATVAFNVSPSEFALYSVADMLERVTRTHTINPNLLEIEITEEAILDTEGAGEQLKRLENAGYKLAVDDFGMGHSSLAYLVSLKVDRLKIDRSFVTGVSDTRANQELITALVGLGQALTIEIVVEGVETAADAAALEALGCRIGQGYHFARPMPEPALKAWLDVRNRPSPRRVAAMA